MKQKLLSSVVATALASSTLLLAAPPSLAAPAAEQLSTVVAQNGAKLSWDAVEGASAYKVEISSDPTFATVLESSSTYARSYTTRLHHGSDAGRTLYWRVAAYTSGTTSSTLQSWSATQQIQWDAVEAPAATSPEPDKIYDYPAPVKFRWATVPGAVSYELQYTPDGNFQNSAALITQTVASNAFTPSAPLASGDWAWRVRAKLDSASNETNFSAWSHPTDFTVQWRSEDSLVNLVTPEDSTNDSSKLAVSDPVFRWDAVEGARYYRLTIARNVDFTGKIVDNIPVYGTSYVYDKTLLNGEYYWQVVAYDTADKAGAMPAQPQKFVKRWGDQVGPLKPGNPMADTAPVPVEGSIDAFNPEPMGFSDFELSWSAIPRATHYEVTLTPIDGLGGAPLTCNTANTSVTSMVYAGDGGGSPSLLKGDEDCLKDLAPGRTYLWRVLGVDYSGSQTTGLQSPKPVGTLISGLSEPRYITVTNDSSEETQVYSYGNNSVLDLTTDEWEQQEDLTDAPSPVFDWDPAALSDGTKATGYEVRVYRGEGVTNHVATFRTRQTHLRVNGVFSDDNTGQSYYWRVVPYILEGSQIKYFSVLWDYQEALSWTRTSKPLALGADYLEERDGINLLKWEPQFAASPLSGGSRGYQLDYRLAGGAWLSTPLKLEYPFWDAKKSNGDPLAAGTYEFRVRGLDANGDAWGPWSVTKPFTVAPSAPTGVSATALSPSTVEVAWSPADVSEGYQVRMQRDSGGWETIQSSSNVVSQATYTVTDLPAGNYDFSVRSRGKGTQWSPWSTAASVSLTTGALTPVTAANAALPSNDRVLRWNAVPGASRYLVQMSTSEATVASATPTEVVTPYFAPTSEVSFGTAYYWRVVAVAERNSSTSSLTARTVLATSAPRPVYFLTAPERPYQASPDLNSEGNLVVSWTPLSESEAGAATGLSYIVRYRVADQVPVAAWTTTAPTAGSASSYTFSNLARGVRYDFEVAAVNSEGQSPWSTTRSAATATVPTAVRDLTVQNYSSDSGSLSVDWNSPSSSGGANVSGYTVRWRPTAGSTWSSATTGSTSYRISGLVAGTDYTVEVFATNVVGAGPASVANGKTSGSAPLKTQPSSWIKSAGKISGKPKVGKTLAVSKPAYSAAGKAAALKVKYQWTANGKAIKGATKTKLKLTKALKGKKVTVKITFSKAGYKSRTLAPKAVKIR